MWVVRVLLHICVERRLRGSDATEALDLWCGHQKLRPCGKQQPLEKAQKHCAAEVVAGQFCLATSFHCLLENQVGGMFKKFLSKPQFELPKFPTARF